MFCLAKVKTDRKFLFGILRGQKVKVFSSQNLPKHGVKLEYFVMKFLKKRQKIRWHDTLEKIHCGLK